MEEHYLNKDQQANKLINEKSPYLLQHAYNPVNWYPWGDEAFEKARIDNKPIFLSIGYSSCHWCHVMERESFEDEEVAGILNQNYVSIKVDREERPDVDHLYMEACMAFNGQGGWPLSVFLTQDKSPFFAGTYFPKEDSRGMLGFKTVLQRIDEAWKTNNEQILESGKEIISHLKQKQETDKEVGQEDEELAYNQFKKSFDNEYGGFGNAPKFPSVQNLIFLISYGILHPEKDALNGDRWGI